MQLTVSELIKQLQKIEAKGQGDALVVARSAPTDIEMMEPTELIVEEVVLYEKEQEVVLQEAS